MESMVDWLSVFKRRRILVTGDTGFKGSWLSLWLHDLGADVVGYALPPEYPYDLFQQIKLDKLIHHVNGDIRDFSSVQKVFYNFKPEFLFHLAAQPLVRLSYREPKLTFDTNVGGSVNILEAARLTPSLRSLIFVTSDKCYRNKEWVWGYRENDELGGRDPYSASKSAAEIVFYGYQQSFFVNQPNIGVASVRAGNVIGGGDWALDRIVPDSIRALQGNKPVVLRNPNATRPWQHVLEPLSGYLLLAAKLSENLQQFTGSWNFGPSVESVRTVRDLAEALVSNWGQGEIKVNIEGNPVHEANLLQLNCDKAQYKLGWKSRWDFGRSVKETTFWYKEVGLGENALDITKAQIKSYMGEIAND